MSRRLAVGLLVLLACGVFAGSLLPYSLKIALHTTDTVHFIHPILHVVVFAVLAVLAAALAKSRAQFLVGALAVIAFGFAIEVLEAVAFVQPLEVSDVALDSLGTVIGYGLCRLRGIRATG